MKIAIFGINHPVSYELAAKHIKANHEVFGVYRSNFSANKKEIRFLNNIEFFNSSIEFDIIYIIAAFVPRGAYNIPDERFNAENVLIPEMICNKFVNSRIIYMSSVSVFRSDLNNFSENSEVAPENLYAKSKREAELIVSKSKSFAIVRFTSIYGEDIGPNNFVNRAIHQAKEDKEVVQFGNGLRIQNYIHQSDAAGYLFHAGQLRSNECLLALGPDNISNKDVLKIIAKLANVGIKQTGVDNFKSQVYENSYTCNILAFNPGIRIESGISRILSYE